MRPHFPEKSRVFPHCITLPVFMLLLGLVCSVFPAYCAEESAVEAQTQAPKGSDLSPGSVASLPTPPRNSSRQFVQFMKSERKEEEKYLDQRFDRSTALLHNKDLTQEKEIRAFLMTPREKFCRTWNLGRAYDHAFLDIRHGVTISGPHLVGHMTSALDVRPGDKVLEIGTGSGYQSAMLTYLTDQVYTIEIIDPLQKETDALYTTLAAAGYPEYGKIRRKADDGYYGWEEHAPFDKIIVTCGIDHIPPPLLKQLKVGGVMVIPVGPPGSQVILKVSKNQDPQGNPVISREDIYHGRKKEAFVPFTNKGGGTHYNEGR
jgi:protein-L-isoaspartate(D-aspartate) O-methyltransferase